MRIAFLFPDNREVERNYSPTAPYFGTAPTGLLSGFAALGDCSPNTPTGNSASDVPLLDSELEIHVVSCTQQPMKSPEKLADNIWFHSLHVPKIGWLRTGYSGCALAIRKKLREINPDLVHAQGTERECAISAVFCPYPRLLTIHGNLRLIRKVLHPKPWSALTLQSLVEGFSVPRFDGIVCITNYTRRAVERETPRTWVVPNAADPAFYEIAKNPVEEDAASSELPVVLVVANVDVRKNQNAFIQALDPLAKDRRFRVKFFGRCGDDKYGSTFRELVRARGWCEYGGMIGRDELRKEFALATLVALPTHEDNCPMVILEAQAAGLPVVASDVGGIPDLVQDGVTGLLTDPFQVESMRNAVSRILSEPTLVSHLVVNGKRQALEKFHPRAVAMRHLQIYEEVLNSKKPGM